MSKAGAPALSADPAPAPQGSGLGGARPRLGAFCASLSVSIATTALFAARKRSRRSRGQRSLGVSGVFGLRGPRVVAVAS